MKKNKLQLQRDPSAGDHHQDPEPDAGDPEQPPGQPGSGTGCQRSGATARQPGSEAAAATRAAGAIKSETDAML